MIFAFDLTANGVKLAQPLDTPRAAHAAAGRIDAARAMLTIAAMLREDYLIRLIQQVADFLAQIAGHERKRDWGAAIDEAGRAWDELLGVPRELVEVTDSATLAELLREPVKMRIAAQLLAAEARARRGKGDPPGAAVLYRRALELVLEARALEPEDSDEAVLLELSREVPASMIDERYR